MGRPQRKHQTNPIRPEKTIRSKLPNLTTTLRKFEVIQELTGETRSVVNTFLDMVIGDHKAKQAYAS